VVQRYSMWYLTVIEKEIYIYIWIFQYKKKKTKFIKNKNKGIDEYKIYNLNVIFLKMK
jgi:hypothetical protein